MKRFAFGRFALSISAAAAFLAGCGGSQPPIGAPGAIQGSAITVHAQRGGSWMLPEAKSEDLLYVTSFARPSGPFQILVFSYPEGVLVGTLSGFSELVGECADKQGDVFIPDSGASGAGEIYEYAHGGSSPIAVLNAPFNYPSSCSVDAKTGNLAVISVGGVAVFPNASGSPTTYTDSSFQQMNYGGYDDQGNLFVDGLTGGTFDFAELANGEGTFTNISVDGTFHGAGSVQWDGNYITVTTYTGGGRFTPLIYRLQIAGSSATIAGTTSLKTHRNRYNGGQFWIQGKSVIGPDNAGKSVGVWKYSAGGMNTKNIGSIASSAWGVTVSRAPK